MLLVPYNVMFLTTCGGHLAQRQSFVVGCRRFVEEAQELSISKLASTFGAQISGGNCKLFFLPRHLCYPCHDVGLCTNEL